ncbi:hypothetical protein ACSZOK_07895 [Aeromonas veronii]
MRTADSPFFYWSERPYASVTYKGAVAGKIYSLNGVCVSQENNEKAERNDAIPHYPLESWRDWALAFVRSEPKLSTDHLLRLHVLIPDEDLYVWFIGEERSSLNDIRGFLSIHNEFYALDGSVDYDEDDEVKNSEFDRCFSLNSNVIVIPSVDRFHIGGNGDMFDTIIKAMVTSEINYNDELDALVMSVWGEFESDEKYQIIGDVNGSDIKRRVTVYKKI